MNPTLTDFDDDRDTVIIAHDDEPTPSSIPRAPVVRAELARTELTPAPDPRAPASAPAPRAPMAAGRSAGTSSPQTSSARTSSPQSSPARASITRASAARGPITRAPLSSAPNARRAPTTQRVAPPREVRVAAPNLDATGGWAFALEAELERELERQFPLPSKSPRAARPAPAPVRRPSAIEILAALSLVIAGIVLSVVARGIASTNVVAAVLDGGDGDGTPRPRAIEDGAEPRRDAPKTVEPVFPAFRDPSRMP